jgi:LysM repeat protein
MYADMSGGRSSIYFTILMILTAHVVVISGMLLQGCKDSTITNDLAKQDVSASTTVETTSVPAAPSQEMPAPLSPKTSNTDAGSITSSAPAPQTTPVSGMAPAVKSVDIASPPAPSEAKEYVIAKGDTLRAIARENGLSLKALMEANPDVQAKKLQIGQKLQLPAGTAGVAATSATGATPGATADAAPTEGAVCTVKSGDVLLKIAKAHGTTVKRIMALNDLRTPSIRAGQKLKLPAPKA